MKVIVFVTIVLFVVSGEARQPTFFRTYQCINNKCQRTLHPIITLDPIDLKQKNQHTTLSACRLVCEKSGSLWPIPTGFLDIGISYFHVDPRDIFFDTLKVPLSANPILSEMIEIFLRNLGSLCDRNCNRTNALSVTVYLKVESENLDIDWTTDEEYSLEIRRGGSNNKKVLITAPSVYGVRHGLETLSQLIAPSLTMTGERKLVLIDYAMIKDKPVFSHRGLLIDTARNFLPVYDILRTIDGLAATKMNVLHWHATDSQSFPLEMKSLPLMALYGAYSSEETYTASDIAEVTKYAKVRGVRVILELDSPSHAGAGWEWGPETGLGNLAVCINRQPWKEFCIQPPCGQLNPVNPNTFSTLQNMYKDVLDILGTNSVLHLGGDELFQNCWNATPEITSEMVKRGMGLQNEDFLQLWSEFHSAQVEILREITGKSDTKVIIWSSQLTTPNSVKKFLDKNKFVIQTWVEAESELNSELLDLGYNLIISTKNSWYLDHGFWGITKYHTWRDAYKNRIPRKEGVLGGEACMWGEYVVSGTLDSRVWPRTAAIAERLWSDSLTLTTGEVEPRLWAQKERLEYRNIFPEAIAPEWCSQHESQCL